MVREFGGVFLLMAGVFGLFGVVFTAVGGIRRCPWMAGIESVGRMRRHAFEPVYDRLPQAARSSGAWGGYSTS